MSEVSGVDSHKLVRLWWRLSEAEAEKPLCNLIKRQTAFGDDALEGCSRSALSMNTTTRPDLPRFNPDPGLDFMIYVIESRERAKDNNLRALQCLAYAAKSNRLNFQVLIDTVRTTLPSKSRLLSIVSTCLRMR